MSKDVKRMNDLEFFNSNNLKTEHVVIIGKRKRVNEMSKYNLVIEYEARIEEVERELSHNMKRYRNDEISPFIMVMIEKALTERLERLKVVLKVHKELAK